MLMKILYLIKVEYYQHQKIEPKDEEELKYELGENIPYNINENDYNLLD